MQPNDSICITTLGSGIINEVLSSRIGLFLLLLYNMNLKGLIFQPAVHNGFREGLSAVQTLGPQESWKDSCAGKSEFQSLDEQLSPLFKTFSL